MLIYNGGKKAQLSKNLLKGMINRITLLAPKTNGQRVNGVLKISITENHLIKGFLQRY